MEVNPLEELPVIGPVVGLMDRVATDLGIPFWLRAFVELVVVAVLAYQCLRLLFRHILPWAGKTLAEPVAGLFELLRVLALMPDLMISRAMRSFGRRPPEVVYAYGAVVMKVADGLQAVSRAVLPALAGLRKVPSMVLLVVVALGFLIWNGSECVPTADGTCVSPVTHWTSSFEDGKEDATDP